MKIFFILLILSLSVSSCIDLGFVNPQPEGGPDLVEIPTAFNGTYVTHEDTLRIRGNMVISGTDSTNISVSDTVKIRKWNEWYFLNMTERNQGYWTVYAFKRRGNKLIIMIPELKEQSREDLEKRWEVSEHLNESDDVNAYIISPSQDEWKKLLKRKFYAKSTFRKIN